HRRPCHFIRWQRFHQRIQQSLPRPLQTPRPLPARRNSSGIEQVIPVNHKAHLPTSYFTFPPTITVSARPCNCQPVNGVFTLFDLNRCGSTVHRAAGSIIVTSASAPTANVALAIPSTSAGLIVNFASAVGQSSTPGSINFVITNPKHVSNPR